MTRDRWFEAAGPIFLRAASLPGGTFDKTIASLVDVAASTDADLVEYITELAANDVLREAVAVSSGHLSEEVDRILDGGSVSRKKLVRVAVAMTRYARRITGRPTPFGLLASVSVLGGPATDRAGSHSSAPTKTARPDARWFDAASATWRADPEVRASLQVVLNNLCVQRGDRLVLPHVPVRAEGTEKLGSTEELPRELTMRLTPVLSWVRRNTDRPRSYSSLLGEMAREFPRLGQDRLDAFLATLVAHEVLLTEFSTTRLDDDHLATLEDLLPAGTRARHDIRVVREALSDYRATAPGQGGDTWRSLLDTVTGVTPSRSAAPHVDLYRDSALRLPAPVLDEVERCASALWSMSAPSDAFAHMRGYRKAFTDRYGQHGAVRLTELVDPHRGLGYPTGYLYPRTSTTLPTGKRPANERDTERREVLGEFLHRGLNDATRELVLSDDDVRRLTVDDDVPPPRSLDNCFQVLAPDEERLAAGDFTLHLAPAIGSYTAGAMNGRFAGATGTAADLGRLMSDPDGGLPAQVVFLPVLPRALNVMHVPDLLPHTIPVGTFVDPAAEGVIDWRELVVAADGDQLRLHWERTGQEVHPVVPHVVSLSTTAPNLARLLAELPFCGEGRVWQPWDWGPFSTLPCLPRVRLGRVVVSPLTWRPSTRMRHGASRATGWTEAVTRWRDDLRIPDRVHIGRRDQVYELDLSSPFQREILRREITRGEVTVTEPPREAADGNGLLGGHNNEVVVSLRRLAQPNTRDPHPDLDPRRLANTEDRVTHHPGGEWAFVEIQAVPEVHEELITRHLPRLVADVENHLDRWFFMRYRETWDHIRLRLHGPDDTLAPEVWARLLRFGAESRESGLIRDLRIRSYEPEAARYGGAAGLRAAEEWFWADSVLATGLLAAHGQKGETPDRSHLLLAGYVHLLTALGSWDWLDWVDALPTPEGAAPPRREIEAALQLLDPDRARALITGSLPPDRHWALHTSGAAVRRLGEILLPGIGNEDGRGWQDMAVGSLLHMHHNRLYGIDPATEGASVRLLGHAARARRGQLRHRARTRTRTSAEGRDVG
ncbi:hypothetical protein C1701_26075 [Actinoalloteichus sp. AHMU CJ021]|uniref:lantibiotic dehydratase n=1 Tax=Actinoalloteichus sp. AHMU CJ021 TaxID=2072503 RepID=UPI000CA028A3|nr:hypothetical protein C1701_26075 [Actinoalloteichus sp. AHMU CJ021]